MGYQTMLPIWHALRKRFQRKIEKIPEEDLQLTLGDSTVSDLLYHTAEVEYMFSEWFLDKPITGEMTRPSELSGYIALLNVSKEHVTDAIKFFQKMKGMKQSNLTLANRHHLKRWDV